MAVAPLSARFQSLPPLPTIKLGSSSADSRVGGLVHALGPYGSLQGTLLWGWEFLLLPPQPPWVLSIRGLRLYFPALEPWGAGMLCSPAVPPGLSMCQCGAAGSPATTLWGLLAVAWPSPLHNPPPRCVRLPPPCCMSSPPWPLVSTPPMVWMNVSSLSPWSSDFHPVLFSVSSVFLF